MEPLKNRLCGRIKKTIHSILNSIVEPIEKVKKDYDYILIVGIKMGNPFTLSFGKKPSEFISRITQTNQILDDFKGENPSSQVYMITGVRGAGKTVMMTTIASMLTQDK